MTSAPTCNSLNLARPGLAGRSTAFLWLSTLALLVASACATTRPAETGTASPPSTAPASTPTTTPRHKVTVGSAYILSPEGKVWHHRPPSLTDIVVKGAIERFIGSETAKDIKTSAENIPPSSLVEVSIGSAQRLQSSVAFATLNPRWNWSFSIDERDLKRGRDTLLTFAVKDDVDGRVLGKKEMTVDQLLKIGEFPVNDESISTLTIGVEDLPSVPQLRECAPLYIPASHAEMKELLAASTRSQDECGNRLQVLNGDSIRLVASDQVTVTEDISAWGRGPRQVPIDPDGIPSVNGNYALKPLLECPNERPGALVAITSGGCMFIGKGQKTIRQFPQSGDFILAVNSGDPLGRNSGHFVVAVTVNPPTQTSPTSE